MTKFEQIGVNYQYDAQTITDANKSFSISCNICCQKMRCLYNDCDHCAIQQAHNMMVALFNEKEASK